MAASLLLQRFISQRRQLMTYMLLAGSVGIQRNTLSASPMAAAAQKHSAHESNGWRAKKSNGRQANV